MRRSQTGHAGYDQVRAMKAWTRQTLGGAVAAGHAIFVWCNSYTCTCRLEHKELYRSVLTVADLAAYAEKYGADVAFESFRKRLRCRHCGSGDVSTIVDAPYVTPAERARRKGELSGR
jgi:hypothetical protein